MSELRLKSTGTIKLFENDNTSSVTIASPASLGGDRTVTLPDADVTLVSGTMSTGFAVADITGQTALGAEPADTDEFVLSDAGVLKRVDYSYIKGAGKVLQVVQSTTTSSISTDSTSFAATGFTSSITPTASDSKILIQVAGGKLTYDVAGRIDLNMYTQTNGGGYSDLFMILKDNNQSGSHFGQTFSNAYLHSPTTTSQVDYQMYFKVNEGTVYINDSGQIAVTMLEIAA